MKTFLLVPVERRMGSLYKTMLELIITPPPPWVPQDQIYQNSLVAVPFSAFLFVTDLNMVRFMSQTIDKDKDGIFDIVLKRLTQTGFFMATMYHLYNTLRFAGIDPITNPIFYCQNEATRFSKPSKIAHLTLGAIPIYMLYLLNKYEQRKS